MITFLVGTAGSFGIRDYVANRGIELADRVGVVHYEDLTRVSALPATGTIFAGLDQTGPATLAAAAAIHDELSARAAVPRRAEPPVASDAAIRTAPADVRIGCNRFNVIRATDDPAPLRYPVFVRYEHRHNGSMTPLLHDRHALDRALVESERPRDRRAETVGRGVLRHVRRRRSVQEVLGNAHRRQPSFQGTCTPDRRGSPSPAPEIEGTTKRSYVKNWITWPPIRTHDG